MRRSDHEKRMAWTDPSFLLRLAAIVALVLACALFVRAGGPKCVAGTSTSIRPWLASRCCGPKESSPITRIRET